MASQNFLSCSSFQMGEKYVYSGGGSQQSLIKISPEELQKANHDQIIRIRK